MFMERCAIGGSVAPELRGSSVAQGASATGEPLPRLPAVLRCQPGLEMRAGWTIHPVAMLICCAYLAQVHLACCSGTVDVQRFASIVHRFSGSALRSPAHLSRLRLNSRTMSPRTPKRRRLHGR
jgi:hypothetical protein